MKSLKSRTGYVLAALLFLVPYPGHAQEVPGDGALAAAEQVNPKYDDATAALDRSDYDVAIRLFAEVAAEGADRADAALYWLAYAQVRKGDRTEAMRTIGQLRREYPQSAWLDDADYLAAEARGSQAPAYADEGGEDMRMYALNALMHADPERAVPLLEKMIRSDEPTEMRQRALFILMQTQGDEAFDVIAEVARDGSDRELQIHALRHLGMFSGDARSKELLESVYRDSSDPELRQAVLTSYMMGGSTDLLLEIVRTETDEEMRFNAVRHLAMAGGHDELWSLYEDDTVSVEMREVILQTAFMTGQKDRLLGVARTESDLRLRRAAIQALGMVGNGEDEDGGALGAELLELYENNDDAEIRESILNALWMRGDAGSLIGLYESTEDPELRRRIVQALSMVDSDEAVEFLIGLIER
jgi:HEAT repeat protein